ncbi:MAG: MMPL family transporter [Acidimicrobiales bacterium]
MARWCVRRRGVVLVVWLVLLIGLLAVNKAAKPAFSNKFQLPDTPSTRALNLLEKNFKSASGASDQIVFHATSGTLTDPGVMAQAQKILAEAATIPHVGSVASPFGPQGGSQISADHTVAFATVQWDVMDQDLPKPDVKQLISTAQSGATGQLQVALGGNDVENAEQTGSSPSTVLGVVLAMAVLVIAFGAFLAASLPLITALIAIGVGYALTGLLSHIMSVADFATILGILIGLGVGVDYALFIVTRHRAGLRAGRSVEDAAVNAVNTAGRAVFFAAITVCIALLGQFALGVSFLYGVAVSAAITVALTMLASLTLLPALLGFFKTLVLGRKARQQLRDSGPVAEELTKGFWYRWSTGIERRPLLPAVVALVVVVAIALPIFSLHLGLDDAGTDQAGQTTRIAYDLLAKGFGPGFNGPLQLVALLPTPADKAAFVQVADTVGSQPGVAKVVTAPAADLGGVGISIVYPTTSPESVQTAALVSRLRTDVIPKAQAGTGVDVLVGGSTAIESDFSHVLATKLPLFIAVVVVLAFLLLMAVFRTLLIPLIASVMNLLSVGAALGIMNAVFEWGWGQSLFGLSVKAPVEVFVPVLLFSILFGLSMDYEVFLVSRIHEEWIRSHDNDLAVTVGQTETGRVITAAATIMILVFASFILGGSVVIKQFGIGLAGAILIDAFIVRTLIVPSLMHLSGRSNWWLPRWLDRIVPHIHVEAADLPALPGMPEELEKIPAASR